MPHPPSKITPLLKLRPGQHHTASMPHQGRSDVVILPERTVEDVLSHLCREHRDPNERRHQMIELLQHLDLRPPLP